MSCQGNLLLPSIRHQEMILRELGGAYDQPVMRRVFHSIIEIDSADLS